MLLKTVVVNIDYGKLTKIFVLPSTFDDGVKYASFVWFLVKFHSLF